MEWWQVALVFIAANFISSLLRRPNCDANARFTRLEHKLDCLLLHYGLEQPRPPEVSENVWAQLTAGRRIQAIRVYREEHPGASLRDARDFIEDLATRLPNGVC